MLIYLINYRSSKLKPLLADCTGGSSRVGTWYHNCYEGVWGQKGRSKVMPCVASFLLWAKPTFFRANRTVSIADG